MENQNKLRQANSIAHLIRLAGILFFIAMAFQVLTWKYAMFCGVACFIAAPVVNRIMTSE